MSASLQSDNVSAIGLAPAINVLAIARQVLQEEADALHDVAAALAATPARIHPGRAGISPLVPTDRPAD